MYDVGFLFRIAGRVFNPIMKKKRFVKKRSEHKKTAKKPAPVKS